MKVKNKGPHGTSLMSVMGTYFINKFKLSVATHLQYVAHKSDLLKRLSFLVFSLPLPWANRTRKIWCRGLPPPPPPLWAHPDPALQPEPWESHSGLTQGLEGLKQAWLWRGNSTFREVSERGASGPGCGGPAVQLEGWWWIREKRNEGEKEGEE